MLQDLAKDRVKIGRARSARSGIAHRPRCPPRRGRKRSRRSCRARSPPALEERRKGRGRRPCVWKADARPAQARPDCRATRFARETRGGRRSNFSAGRDRSANATREPKVVFQGLRASSAPVSGVDFGHDKRCGGGPRRTEHPFHIGRDRKPPRPRRNVADLQARDLDRIVEAARIAADRVRCRGRHVRTGYSLGRAGRYRARPRPRIGSAVGPHKSPLSSSRT